MNYDPGAPKRITHIKDRVYGVQSFTDEDVQYEVDLDNQTCTCPHYVKILAGTNGKCKHIQATDKEEVNYHLIQKARKLKDSDLQKCLQRYQRIYSALKIVHQERQLADRRNAEMKALFS